jgi:hypothetical protein
MAKGHPSPSLVKSLYRIYRGHGELCDFASEILQISYTCTIEEKSINAYVIAFKVDREDVVTYNQATLKSSDCADVCHHRSCQGNHHFHLNPSHRVHQFAVRHPSFTTDTQLKNCHGPNHIIHSHCKYEESPPNFELLEWFFSFDNDKRLSSLLLHDIDSADCHWSESDLSKCFIDNERVGMRGLALVNGITVSG